MRSPINAGAKTMSYFGFVSDAKNPSGLLLRRLSLEEHLKASLRAALLTQVGERKLRSEVGSTLKDYLFRPLVPSLEAEVAAEVEKAIQKAEPRVELIQVSITHDAGDKGRLIVQLRYRIKETQKIDRCQFSLQT